MDGGHKYVQRTFRLKAETVQKLDEYSQRTGVTRTFAVEKAILDYLSSDGQPVSDPAPNSREEVAT